MLRANPNIRYEPQERCPPGMALVSALQILVPNAISIVVLLTLIARARGIPTTIWARYLSIFTTIDPVKGQNRQDY